MLQRKIISASISGSAFAVLFCVIVEAGASDAFISIISGIGSFLIFSFSITLIYGIAASIISDAVAWLFTRKSNSTSDKLLISGVLHSFFGLLFFYFGLFAALLFFVTDKYLEKKHAHFKWSQAAISLLLPAGIWLLSISIAPLFT
ncbi:hypothetical protein [Lysinibacillus sp. 3P01SB]|uniref:hypothetical protein n=1 Tax=Lysinibacillus sp. 3P01SB TaxID=3132284 RepID=UPI0039A5BC91